MDVSIVSIRKAFYNNPNVSIRHLPKPPRLIPKPKNLESKQKKFFKDVLPNARTAQGGGKTVGACVQINGGWSSGKTLVLDFLAVERFENEGISGIANYPLHVPGYKFFNDELEINGKYGIDALSEIRGEIIQIDELQRYIDSYMSRSQSNLFISNIIADFGKQGNDFYYTNQHHNAAPTRVRTNISFVALPQYDETNGWCTVYLFQSIPKFLWMEPFFYFGFYAPNYWDYYDTRYKVEDYVFKFKSDPFIRDFILWCKSARKISKLDVFDMKTKKLRDTLKLWDASEGKELSSGEVSLIMTDMEYKDIWAGTGG